MAEIDLKLPQEWTERSVDEGGEQAVAKYHYETAEKTTFIVAVTQQASDPGKYKVRLSTISPTSTPVRHDYPVQEYETLSEAVEGTQSFLNQIASRLDNDEISRDDPSIEEIRSVIRDFSTGDGLLPVRRLIQRLR